MVKAGNNFYSCQNSVENKDLSIKTVSSGDIIDMTNQTTEELQALIPLDKTLIRLLLSRFRWDSNGLLERFLEYENPAKFLSATIWRGIDKNMSDAPVISLQKHQPNRWSPDCLTELSVVKGTSVGECEVCCEEVPSDELLALGCGHYFCKTCWIRQAKCKVDDENVENGVQCLACGCNYIISDESLFDLLTHPQTRAEPNCEPATGTLEHYRKSMVNQFVAHHPSFSWCPGPRCERIICASVRDSEWEMALKITNRVACPGCKTEFCFACGNDYHQPLLCQHMKMWKRASEMFLDTPEELLGKVKHCPKCYVRIEKISGCNEMVCGNRDCGYRFCWLCLKGCDVHGLSTCSYYSGLLWDRNKSLKLQFHFYYDRYRDQMGSLNRKIELTKQIETSLEPGKVKSRSTRAGDILVESRRTLVSSFIFAAILAENNDSLLLHSNQNELQRAAEELSRFLHTIPERVALIDVDKLQHLASYCKSRCAIVTQQILDGYERNAWGYLAPN